MGLFRNKPESHPYRYVMRERLISFGDDFYIDNADGLRCFWVDGKALRIRQTIMFKDVQGIEYYKVQDKVARVRDTMEIEYAHQSGHAAVVKKALISPIRHRFDIKIPDGEDLDAKGNIANHEYKIHRGDAVIAEISKKWIRVRETYTVDITPGENVLLILAITTAIDAMADPG